MGVRTLIVDDAEYMRQMLIMMLKKAHIDDIVQASNGEDALKILEGGQIKLVLLDCVMPKMDGLEVLKAIRANPKIAKTPVILVTGHADEHIITKARSAEYRADGIIAKPLSLATLELEVATVLAAASKVR